ncbi:hypothetical protein [Halopseudomonas sp. SMJS2]|uniref:hypothetical protein n=1 Tax=Halopseudomonas sp. SMJS2 TaxID=3041098 RepID=UPI0032970FA3
MNLNTNESAPQLDLFACVAEAYKRSPDEPLSNERLYQLVAQKAGIPMSELDAREPVGTSGQMHSLKARELRWHQQTLKHMGVIERVPGQRGVWSLTDKAKKELHPPKPGVKLLGFSTELGCAVWGYSQEVLQNCDTPITLAITSTPYPCANNAPTAIRRPRTLWISSAKSWSRSWTSYLTTAVSCSTSAMTALSRGRRSARPTLSA